MTARWIDLDAVSAALEAEWLALSERALEGNGFLSPWFLQPAARRLDPGRPLRLLTVEAHRNDARVGLVALACLHAAAPRRSLPWPHAALFGPVHAYSSGVLVDPRWPDESLRCLLVALGEAGEPAHGALRLPNLRCDGPLAASLQRVLAGTDVTWFPTRQAARAAIRPAAASAPDDAARVPTTPAAAVVARTRPVEGTPEMPQQLWRGLRRLASSAGTVEFRVLRGAAIDAAAVERHLRLEHAGWKGDRGSALLANLAHAQFFREVVQGAAARDAVFLCELLAGGSVVASTSNFVAGRQAHAFKVGWDPAHARCSPGLLVDQALVEHASTTLAGLESIDSCADPGSHLERIWPARIAVADGYLAWGRLERALLTGLATARRWRDGARRRVLGR